MNQIVRQQFGRAASGYHERADVQKEVAVKLATQFFPKACPERILEVGCGSGFLTRELCARYPEAKIDAVDISREMIDLAQKNIGLNNKVKFHCLDVMRYSPNLPYDLIVSSAAMQWLRPFESGVGHLKSLLANNGELAFSIMTSGTLALMHTLRNEMFSSKKVSSQLPRAGAVEKILSKFDLAIESFEEEKYLQQLMPQANIFSELKAIGVTAGVATKDVVLSRSELLQLSEAYRKECWAKYGENCLEYEVLFCRVRWQRQSCVNLNLPD